MRKPQSRSRPTRDEGKKAFLAHRFNIFFRRRQAKVTGSSQISVQAGTQPGDPGGQARPDSNGGGHSAPVPGSHVQSSGFWPVIIGQRYSLSTPAALEFHQAFLLGRCPAQVESASVRNGILDGPPDQNVVRTMLQMGWIGRSKTIDPCPGPLPYGDGSGRGPCWSTGQVHSRKPRGLEPGAGLSKEPARWSGKAVCVSGSLLKLGHDQPIGDPFTLMDDQACPLSFPDASLGTSRVQAAPHGGFTAIDWYLKRRIVRSSVKPGCRREL